jgi:hypothetical protein
MFVKYVNDERERERGGVPVGQFLCPDSTTFTLKIKLSERLASILAGAVVALIGQFFC